MSSRSLNRVSLIGNLTRDPELRYTPQGTPVCTFGLATNRSWTPSAGGERQEETEFHRIVSWNKLAELCSELLFKGRKAFVEGRLQTRNWTDASGQERTTVEIVIDNMIILDSKRKDDQPGQTGGGGQYQQTDYAGQQASDDDQAVVDDDQAVVDDDQAGEVKVEEKSQSEADQPKVEAKSSSKKKDDQAGADSEKVNPDDIPF